MSDVVTRFDTGTLGKATKTPQGFLRVPAFLTRAGVFDYRRADGTVRRELRLPEEIFRADSLASLSAAPVTDLHPTEMVSPKNVKALQVGHVGESVRRDGKFVAAHVIVAAEDAIGKVERGDLRELSCGYRCKLDATPGTYEGQRYDAIQRDIQYNHVALGPRNWGRAGTDVALRLDAGDAGGGVACEEVMPAPEGDDNTYRYDSADRRGSDRTMSDLITIRIDGHDLEVSKATASSLEQLLKKREDGHSAALAAAKGEKDALQGRLDGVTKDLTESKAKLAAAEDPKRLDGAIAARLSLIEKARKVLGAEEKLDGKTEREIKVLVVKAVDEKFDATEKTDDYLQGRFDTAIESAPAKKTTSQRTDSSVDRVRRAVTPTRKDASQERADRQERPLPAWQRPLATNKS